MAKQPYTHTTWRVKPDMEAEFVERWSEWADWSHQQGLDPPALLLRDVEDPQTFVSFGPWESITAVRGWRARPGYQERVVKMLEVLESFEPRTLEVVVSR